MRLNLQTDHALRLLMALARQEHDLLSVDQAARMFRVSKNHLAKTAQTLVAAGLLVSVRGRAGGLRLAKRPAEITVGAVIRAVEHDLGVVECLGLDPSTSCFFLPGCQLKRTLSRATEAFLRETDSVTLQDLVPRRAA